MFSNAHVFLPAQGPEILNCLKKKQKEKLRIRIQAFGTFFFSLPLVKLGGAFNFFYRVVLYKVGSQELQERARLSNLMHLFCFVLFRSLQVATAWTSSCSLLDSKSDWLNVTQLR